jgi:hypothetical protein
MAANKALEVRAAGAEYQSMLGGTAAAGVGQAALGQGYRLGQMITGGFTGAQAGEAFQGVTALGYQGGARQERLNFASSNYRSMGMSVKESMDIISLAAKNLGTNFRSLHDDLKSVSDMAKQTGQNAQVLRASFTQNLGQATQAGVGMNAGAQLATAMTAVTGGLGRSYCQIGFGGLLSQRGMMIAAAQSGYANYSQFVGRAAQNPQLMANASQKMINQALDSAIDANGKAGIQQLIQRAGGNDKVMRSEHAAADRPGCMSAGYQLVAIQNTLASRGIDVSKLNPQIAGWVVAWAAGGVNLSGQVAKQTQGMDQMSIRDLAMGTGNAVLVVQATRRHLARQDQEHQLGLPGKMFDPVIGKCSRGSVHGLVTVQTKDGR